jgi:hypothetical protein
MVASGLRTMIAGSLSSYIAGFLLSCRFSQSPGTRRSCVGTEPDFAATGVGSRAHGEGVRITEAFPWNEAPRYMIWDRDCIYGAVVTRRLRAMGIRDKTITPSTPWQNVWGEIGDCSGGFAQLMSTWLSPAPSASAATCTGPASSKLPQTDAEAG